MLFVLLLPVVLNLCAPTLMGRGLRNTIITASILFLGVLFLFIRFLGRTIQDDLLSAEKLGI